MYKASKPTGSSFLDCSFVLLSRFGSDLPLHESVSELLLIFGSWEFMLRQTWLEACLES